MFFVIAIFHFNNSYSQKKRRANDESYIATDTSIHTGLKLIGGLRKTNSQYIIVKKGNLEVKYTPVELKEYSLKDGTLYEAKRISIGSEDRVVFLERVVHGKMTLYAYVDNEFRKYYIKKDSSAMHELQYDMQAFRELATDCKNSTDVIPLASLDRASLRRLALYYNTCSSKLFPYKKFGIMVGLGKLSLLRTSDFGSPIDKMFIPSSTSPVIGAFVDLPLGFSYFSFHPEMFLSRNTFSASYKTNQSDTDLLVSLTTLQLPILFRYTTPVSGGIRPFINAGPYFSYNIENESVVYVGSRVNNDVTLEKPAHEKLIANFSLGYSVGAGTQINLNYRKTMSFEIRYTRTTTKDKRLMAQRGFDFILGFTF